MAVMRSSKCPTVKLSANGPSSSERKVRSSRGTSARLAEDVTRAIALFQNATDLVDAAVADSLAINTTDRRALDILFREGFLTTGQLARALDLSPGATTTAVDRLLKAGLVRRVDDNLDRRRAVVTLTNKAYAHLARLYGPIGEAGHAQLARYPHDQLTAFLDMLGRGRALQIEHAAWIRAGVVEPTSLPKTTELARRTLRPRARRSAPAERRDSPVEAVS